MASLVKETLLSEINQTIKSYKDKAGRNRSFALIATLVTTGLGVITTVILGLNTDKHSALLNTIALILSALVVFNQALTSFFNNKEFWIEFNEKTNDLRKLKFDMKLEEAEHGDISPPKLIEFTTRYQAVVDAMNSFWRFNRTKKTIQDENKGS